MSDTETGFRWWMRYVFIPLVGSGGVVAILAFVHSLQTPTPSPPIPSPPILPPPTRTPEPRHGPLFPTPPPTSTPLISLPKPAPVSTPRSVPLGWIEFGTFDATKKRWTRPKYLDHTFFDQLPNLNISDTFAVTDDLTLEEQPLGGRMLGWIPKGARVRIDKTFVALNRKKNMGFLDNRDYQVITARVTEIIPASSFKPK